MKKAESFALSVLCQDPAVFGMSFSRMFIYSIHLADKMESPMGLISVGRAAKVWHDANGNKLTWLFCRVEPEPPEEAVGCGGGQQEAERHGAGRELLRLPQVRRAAAPGGGGTRLPD